MPAKTLRSAPDERAAEIVTAAQQLFATRGILKTTFTDIARHVGIARGLVYHYFPDKDALINAVLTDHIDQFVAAVRAWDEKREPGNINKALRDCISVSVAGWLTRTRSALAPMRHYELRGLKCPAAPRISREL